MSAPTDIATLADRLDVLIRIQAALAVKEMTSQREKIAFLHGAGLGPTAIATLLGTTPKTVSVTVARHKKAGSAAREQSDE